MGEFRVQLFPSGSMKPKGFLGAIKSIFGGKQKLREGDFLDLNIGGLTEYDYNCVDVYSNGELVGEIRKKGIDEIIEKGALEGARYSGYIHDVSQITITCLETHEYRDKPEYKVWREKLQKEIDAEKEEREKSFPTELNRMLKDLSSKTDPSDRNFLLQTIVSATDKRRKIPKIRKVCREIGMKHLSEFKDLAPSLKKESGGSLPRVTTFQHLATVFMEDRDYDRAVKICKMALKYKLHDGTKGGYEGRIKSIERKKNKARN